MYATVRWYADPEVAENLKSRAEEVLGIVSAISGFHAYYLIETADGTVSVTVYDDAASASASNEAAASWLRENMPGVTASNVTGGEVVVSK
jgi:inosine-uridine nucleoside N-ribohydrolase